MDSRINWKEVSVDTGKVWTKEKPLEGIFVETEHDVGSNKSNMYTIKTDDGEVKVWGSTVLDDKLMSLPMGTYVKLEYEGKLKSKKGTEYHSYKVFFDEDSISKDTGTDAGSDDDLSSVFPE